MLLSDAVIGQSCSVVNLNLPAELSHRLEALGMTHQSRLQILNRKGHGILIIRLRGTRYALGYNITSHIEVTPCQGERHGR